MDFTLASRNYSLYPQQGLVVQERTYVLVAVITIAVCLNYAWPVLFGELCLLDRTLMVELNFTGSAQTDRFFYAFSHLNSWLPMAALAVTSVAVRSRRHLVPLLVFIVSLALLLTLTDQISSSVIKPLAGRLRPSHDPAIAGLLHYVNQYRGGMYGFVSSHATYITALVTWLCFFYRDRLIRASLIVFGVVMCYSRIYLGVHYPGDIICGALLGFTIAYFSYYWLSKRIALPRTGSRAYEIPVGLALSAGAMMLL